MAESVKPGERLRSMINLRRLRDFEVADYCEISTSTLSRYINGKQNISDKVLLRAATLLDTNLKYLKCESNDPTPQRYIDMSRGMDEEASKRASFAYKTSGLREFLSALGVRFTHRLHIGKMIFQLADNLVWYPLTDVESDYYLEGLDNIEYLEEVKKRPNESYFENVIEYQGKQVIMTDSEYDRFMIRLIASTETLLQDKFELPYTYIPAVPENVIDPKFTEPEENK